VTRLGKFSPNGWLFTLSSLLKIAKKQLTFRGYLFPRWGFCINLDKKLVGLYFGRLFLSNLPTVANLLFNICSGRV
jgi:hypothetical protein